MSQAISGQAGHSEQAIAAREALWTYYSASAEEGDYKFFDELSKAVEAELTRTMKPGTRLWVGREAQLRVGPYLLRARLTNIEPLLATTAGDAIRMLAQARKPPKDGEMDVSTFISEVIRYPNERLGATFDSLVGIQPIKDDLFRKLTLLISPQYLDRWLVNSYREEAPPNVAHLLHDRYPLLVLEGEVGSGKTALARSIGQVLAKQLKTELVLYVVNAQVRGSGHVGELTQNISRAFAEAEQRQEREDIPVLLLIDEADALAQARGGRQTHHEDDAGVNTLIQRIDHLRGRPMAVLFATNLVQSLDAAILRRATATYHFDRPDEAQRAEAFKRLLKGVDITADAVAEFATQTQPTTLPGFGDQKHRYTYSDLSQRILARAIEEAVYARQPLTADIIVQACRQVLPTPEMVPAMVGPHTRGA